MSLELSTFGLQAAAVLSSLPDKELRHKPALTATLVELQEAAGGLCVMSCLAFVHHLWLKCSASEACTTMARQQHAREHPGHD